MSANSTNLSQRNGAARRTVVFGKHRIRIEDVVALARGEASAAIDHDPAYRERLEASRTLLRQLRDQGKVAIYGVTTGVGASVGNAIPSEFAEDLGLNLFIASFRFREPIVHLYRASLPWLGLYLVALVLVTYLPELSLWLVRALGIR